MTILIGVTPTEEGGSLEARGGKLGPEGAEEILVALGSRGFTVTTSAGSRALGAFSFANAIVRLFADLRLRDFRLWS